MIIEKKRGDILKSNEKRIAFAVNTEGANGFGFAGRISRNFWPELEYIGRTELGTVFTKNVSGIEFFALCCYSIKDGWNNQKDVIKQCFDAIPGDEPVASVSMGIGIIDFLLCANFKLIRAGMETSEKKIILY